MRLSAPLCCVLVALSCTSAHEPRNPVDFATTSQGLTACASGPTLPGLDVSSYQLSINWSAVSGSGIKWAYAKATEGNYYQDATFPANWSGMKANGVVRGAYHFFHPSINGTAQADYFLDYVGAIGAGDLPPMLDWEVSDNVSGATAGANGEAFIQEIAARTGKSTVIYTAPGLWDGFGIQGNFGGNALFVANWLYCDTGSCCPEVPNGWGNWQLWQWNDSGNTSGNPSVPGVPARVDLDVFNGDEAQLAAFAQGGATVSSDPCSGVPAADNGLYCGTSSENGFLGGNSSTLYDCENSVTQSTIHCADGCISEPAGMNDICNTSANNPCGPVPSSANGLYCGSETENGFAGGNANTLYNCEDGTTAGTTACPNGCTEEPAGMNDLCTASANNPCGPVPASANGLYCGSETENGFTGGNANTLYDCVDGATASTTACPNGCTEEPAGMNDLCTASSSNPCAPVPSSANGMYCGSQTENGFSGGNPSTLYDCVDGSTVGTTACPNGCTEEPAGLNDLCTGTSSNPCAPVASAANGLYCGSETENGFSGGNPNTLYDCVNGSTVNTTGCPEGCISEPAGMNDVCRATSGNPCGPVPNAANGLYCGGQTENGFAGGNPNTLYDCVNGSTVGTTACPNGCTEEPAGMNDLCTGTSSNPCAPVPSAANGLYCGDQTEYGFSGGNPNTLYDCVGGKTTNTTPCQYGCIREPEGMNDMCNASSTNPCAPVESSANGLYCGSQTENGFGGGDPNTLYDCVNGGTASTTACSNGCTMEPVGTNDMCTPSPSDPCSTVPASAGGLYCGGSTENGFGGGNANTLYDCVNGATKSTLQCPNGCTQEPPGMDDYCTPAATSSDPCSKVPAADNGIYCGTSTENGFAGGDPNTLYDCVSSATASTTHCASGCTSEPAGMNDICNAPPPPMGPCASVPSSGNGTYCGSSRANGFAGGTAGTLYTCQDGTTSATSPCANGCTLSSSGTMDACSATPTDPCSPVPASDNGTYCGGSGENGFLGGDLSVLYACQNGHTATATSCPNGCDISASGTMDACATAPVDAGPPPDAGSTTAPDSGPAIDGGNVSGDAGLQIDAGTDAGFEIDAGADAGTELDAGNMNGDDGGSVADAGTIAAADAGPADGGSPTIVKTGCQCGSAGDLMPGLLALAMLLRLRRRGS